jgi:hypothetical protein
LSADDLDIRELFEQAPELDRSVRDAEAAVVRWIWTRENSDRWRAEPLWALRVGLKPGSDFKAPPKRLHGVERYGYDSAGRLMLAQRYDDGAVDGTVIADEADDASIRWDFDCFGSLEAVSRAVLDPSTGRVVGTRVFSRVGSREAHSAERFSYDDAGRLVSVRFEARGGDYDSWPRRRRGEERISYGPDGQPVRVVVHYDDPSAEPQTVYGTHRGNLGRARRRRARTPGAGDRRRGELVLGAAGTGSALVPECRRGRAATGRRRVLCGAARPAHMRKSASGDCWCVAMRSDTGVDATR